MRVRVWGRESVSKCVCVYVSTWVSEWVSVWVSEWVNEWMYHHHHSHNHIHHHAIIIVIIIIVIRGIDKAFVCRSFIVLPSDEVVKEGGRDLGWPAVRGLVTAVSLLVGPFLADFVFRNYYWLSVAYSILGGFVHSFCLVENDVIHQALMRLWSMSLWSVGKGWNVVA